MPPRKKSAPVGAMKIIRENPITRAWWCPVCDFSMDRKLDHCQSCGAARAGDYVQPRQDITAMVRERDEPPPDEPLEGPDDEQEVAP